MHFVQRGYIYDHKDLSRYQCLVTLSKGKCNYLYIINSESLFNIFMNSSTIAWLTSTASTIIVSPHPEIMCLLPDVLPYVLMINSTHLKFLIKAFMLK